jgi:hypothetical protein
MMEAEVVEIIAKQLPYLTTTALEKIKRIIKREIPSQPALAKTEYVLPNSIVENTRRYIEQIVYQINGCYAQGCFDACAVMTRRLIETLIIESFEKYNIADNIKSVDGNYLYLRDLINKSLEEKAWNLGRNTKAALKRLKDIGDLSAHSRRFIAHRSDIDNIIPDLRIVVQEFVHLAEIQKHKK